MHADYLLLTTLGLLFILGPPEHFLGTVIASVLSCLAAPLLLRRRPARVALGAEGRPR